MRWTNGDLRILQLFRGFQRLFLYSRRRRLMAAPPRSHFPLMQTCQLMNVLCNEKDPCVLNPTRSDPREWATFPVRAAARLPG